jgi:hypothetical protein
MEDIFRKEKFYSVAEELSDLKFQLLQEPAAKALFSKRPVCPA